MSPEELAAVLLDEAVEQEQATRRIRSNDDAAAVRAIVRRLARQRGVRIRTARIDETVAVVRTDAAIWTDDAATMRAKLAPPDES